MEIQKFAYTYTFRTYLQCTLYKVTPLQYKVRKIAILYNYTLQHMVEQ